MGGAIFVWHNVSYWLIHFLEWTQNSCFIPVIKPLDAQIANFPNFCSGYVTA